MNRSFIKDSYERSEPLSPVLINIQEKNKDSFFPKLTQLGPVTITIALHEPKRLLQ